MGEFREEAEAVIDGTAGIDVPSRLDIDDLAIACLAYRKSSYIGLREAARQIGMSPTTLSRFEKGKPIDIDTMKGICRWLGVRKLTIDIPKQQDHRNG